MQCCLTILHNKIALYHYKNVMQIYQYVKGIPRLASNKHNFHLCCHGHVPSIKYKEEAVVNFDVQKQRTFGQRRVDIHSIEQSFKL